MLIIGLIVTFSLILILVTRKVPIGMAVLFGGVILALFAGLRAPQIIKIILLTFTQKGTQQLILTVVLISILSTMMQEYGIMDLMIKYLEKTFKSIKHCFLSFLPFYQPLLPPVLPLLPPRLLTG